MDRADLPLDLEGLRQALRDLEQRLLLVEQSLGFISRDEASALRGEADGEAAAAGLGAVDDVALEYRIGELWVGQVGVVALLIGIAFFISYPFGAAFPPVLQSLAGYLTVAGFFALSHHWKAPYPHTARILFTGSLILLYFSTLRLHFFTDTPIVPQKALGLALVTLVLGLLLYVAVARRSRYLTCLVLFLGFTTALCSDTAHFALALVAATSAAAVALRLRYGWVQAALLSVILAYAVHLIWVFNNPILGHPLQAISEHHHNLVYLFVYAALFGVANLPRRRAQDSALSTNALVFLNGAGFYCLSAIVAATYFRAQFAWVNLLIAAFFLALASTYWVYRQSRFSTAFYACFGYVALSVAIVAHFGDPDRFVWLGWQSLLVISTAIWFRSRIVVVANVLIYLGILSFYLLFRPPDLAVNLSYAGVGLLSARVMNWQKQRLALKTEVMRNVYLASAFVVVPYGLYHGVPGDYVSLSWLGASLFYFALSLVLKNRKYRWMAILTMFLTVFYILAVDLSRLQPIYRMVLFLVLGLTMLAVSWVYARYRRRENPGDEI